MPVRPVTNTRQAVGQHKPAEDSHTRIFSKSPPRVFAQAFRASSPRQKVLFRVRDLAPGVQARLWVRPPSGSRAKFLHRRTVSQRETSKSREEPEMRPLSGRGSSGKCSPKPRKPRLEGQVAKRPRPLTSARARGARQ